MEAIKVCAKSNPKAVAGAIASVLKEQNGIDIDAIGAAAVNQAVKAVVIARGFMSPKGKELVIVPSFRETEIDGEMRTAIRLQVEVR